MKITLALGLFLMLALMGVGMAHAQTSSTGSSSTYGSGTSGNTSGTSGSNTSSTPGVPNTAANPMANIIALAVSGLVASGGILYLKKNRA